MIDIIIPVYNEKQNIAILCELISQSVYLPYQICIIDDSTDETTDIINSLKEQYPITHIRRNKKSGIGSAYKEAINATKNPYIIIMDGDLSHDPKYITRFVNDGADIVISTRYKDGGSAQWTFIRKLISRGANNLVKIFLGMEYSDVTGSYRMYRRDRMKEIIEEVKEDGFGFQVEALYIAHRKKFRISERAIIFHERIISKSKMDWKECWKFAMMVVRISLKRFGFW